MSEGEQNAWGSGWLFCFQILHLIQSEGLGRGRRAIDSFPELRGEALQAKGINYWGFVSLTLTCQPLKSFLLF